MMQWREMMHGHNVMKMTFRTCYDGEDILCYAYTIILAFGTNCYKTGPVLYIYHGAWSYKFRL